jgi:hypothetical protein
MCPALSPHRLDAGFTRDARKPHPFAASRSLFLNKGMTEGGSLVIFTVEKTAVPSRLNLQMLFRGDTPV